MTEQPGPGHMVMAAARAPGGAGWVLARPLRPPRAGTTHTTLTIQYRDRPFLAPRRSPAASRRQARSSSPLRGCGRSSLTPGRAARRPGHLRGRIQENSQPSSAARVVTGPDPYALLTMVALMGGCRIAGVASSYTYAADCMSFTVAAIVNSASSFVSGARRTPDRSGIDSRSAMWGDRVSSRIEQAGSWPNHFAGL